MTEEQVRDIVKKQRAYFRSGATLPVAGRLKALNKLKKWIQKEQGAIAEALRQDLGKSAFESYMCETGLVLSEIGFMRKNLRELAHDQPVPTPLVQFRAKSYQKPSPYGVALIMSPWNYPFLLTADPLVSAIAAGNTVVLKPSAYAPASSALLERMAAECFTGEQVAVVTGGRAENGFLLQQRFDRIFFTGSQSVGKEVMRQAARYLTPVLLELGGKSPCIVEKSADIKLAARRIVFGKFLNCGQTCVAPDYIYCDRAVKDALIEAMKVEIERQYGGRPLRNPDYGKIVNEKHFDRLNGLIDGRRVVCGGTAVRETLQIVPTIMDEVTFEDRVMWDEIFGPILPVLAYDSLDEALREIEDRPHPLALYIFTGKRAVARQVMERCSFGGGCVNDVVIHLATSEMGFGGFGESGMGAYHGKAGFDAFTHYKSIVDKKTWLDLPMRYQPYRGAYEKLIHLFLR